MEMTSLIIVGVVVLVAIITIIGILSRYRKCKSDELLVVYGKTGSHKEKVSERDAKGNLVDREVEIKTAKVYHGGAAFVWPIIQGYEVMSMQPIQLNLVLKNALSAQNIRVTIPTTVTVAISQEPLIMQNAANRLLGADDDVKESLISDIVYGQMRLVIASMTIEELNSDRDKFLAQARDNINTELNKLGLYLMNINISDIQDAAQYIDNLGKKEETKARAQSQADIAEEEKKGAIQIAQTTREKEIAIAAATKEQETIVAETNREKEVAIAKTTKEKETQLAEQHKEQQIAVAEQRKEREIGVATAQTEEASKVAEQEALRAAKIAEQQAYATAKEAEFTAKAEAAKAEAEAEKEVRMAVAAQNQEAETVKAQQEKEAKTAQYESEARQKAAEAEKAAGVAEQKATIEVSKAKGEAEKAKAEAQMAVAKTEQERQVEVNEAKAKAEEAKLKAEVIIPAEKAKEKAKIEAEAVKSVAILEAEAEAAKILKAAEAKANATKMQLEAEAEGTKKKLLAEAEGKKASLMAEAEQKQAMEMAPALAVEHMIKSGMHPEAIVQYAMTDRWKEVAEANAKVFEHIQLGNVTVYGDSNTAGQFMANMAKNLAPSLEIARNLPIADSLKQIITGKKPEESPAKGDNFPPVK